MIYELRIYHCVTGRLPALLKRFETTTLEIWKRHGIRQAGFWTVMVGEGGNQDLHYLLAWESLAERETKWNKFTADPEWLAKRAQLGSDGFSTLFGRFNESFLKHQQGLSILLLEGGDAAGDAAAFKSAGIAASDAMKFEREGKRPDGSTVKLGFSLAFARDGGAPEIGFATCQQHFPENFWNPEFQQHPNTASGVAGVTLVAENPTDHHI